MNSRKTIGKTVLVTFDICNLYKYFHMHSFVDQQVSDWRLPYLGQNNLNNNKQGIISFEKINNESGMKHKIYHT